MAAVLAFNLPSFEDSDDEIWEEEFNNDLWGDDEDEEDDDDEKEKESDIGKITITRLNTKISSDGE